ncbi:MAG: PIG-L family deacetylase [Cyclobacteriaceae bacterium]|nr:PIG-L family deacetylase [Cyclobacteriaceae bacterium]
MRVLFILLVFITRITFAQQGQPSASEIKLKLKKLNFLGSILYVAAHPDDENTRAITFLANDQLVATAYLSMTRGDGGQNLIGPEIGELLGLIRTQELLAARRIDGGQQFFTRAIDFGFSKNYHETLEIWNKEEILSDVVQVIRQFQPDVILTRFPADERAGHGHHTSSAILAQEAFDVSNNPEIFPEQVPTFGTWQVSTLYTNTGRWWNQTISEKTPDIVTMNVGTYNPLLGKSYSEIAAASRTSHKSQGFGSSGSRGDSQEFFEFVKGTKVNNDFFENINTSWARVKGGDKVQPLVQKVIAEFNEDMPELSVPVLLEVRKQIMLLDNSVWKQRKLKETEQLLLDCSGLYIGVRASHYVTTSDQPVRVSFEAINRSDVPITLLQVKSLMLSLDSTITLPLKNNASVTFKSVKNLSSNASYSAPYWLKDSHSIGLYNVTDKSLIGKPENDAAITIEVTISIMGEKLTRTVPVIYSWTDPVRGELIRPVEITPLVFVNFPQSVYVFKDQSAQPIRVLIKSESQKQIAGSLTLVLPSGWKCEPAAIPFELSSIGEEQTFVFNVTGSKIEMDATIKAVAEIGGKPYSHSIQQIVYDHIPIQILQPEAKARALRINILKTGSIIGYIKGAGDDIPASLRHLGYEVWEMKNEEVTAANLQRVDAVVLGIRALNTNERIRFIMPALLDYVKNGGTMVVQYNTSNDIEIDEDKFSPYPLTLSRDRVTQENSEVRILKPDHPVLNYPNKITSKDFDGWVQERGLYFPSAWSERYDALLSMNDTGEPARNGSLLIAKYGEGHYVYTGLSFFRELPEGVPGAYKLFANLVSLKIGKSLPNEKIKTKK